MIRDPAVKAEIEQEWATVRDLANWSRDYVLGGGSGGIFVNETPPGGFYNLPLVLAYSTLDNVLAQLLTEGAFHCLQKNGQPCFGLKDKMRASRTALPWVDYARVERGRVARNEVAHDTKLHNKKTCIEFIKAVEAELRSWGVLT
jgi:hypothetical protein